MRRKSHQFPKQRRKAVVDWIQGATDRNSQRRALAEKWRDEGQYTDYRYNVETCEDGSKVYLLRPTWLNKGFDFQVNLAGFRSRTRAPKGTTIEMPSHEDVVDDLRRKVEAHPKLKEEIFEAVCDVYDCKEPIEILRGRPKLRVIKAGLPMDKTVRIIKWLFIEQDLTYWLRTGRDMLMSAIETRVFGLDSDLITRK